jgi:hypothetical protein
MRLLQRLRHHVAHRRFEIFSLVAGERLLHQHPRYHRQPLEPHRALLRLIDIESAELDFRGALAGAEFAAPVAHQVERRDPLGDSRRMVDPRRHLHDSVSQPDILGALARRGEPNLRRRRMRILFEKMMLGRPHVVVAEPVREFDLVQRVLE